MTRDTWTIIGTMVTIGSIIVALGAIAINQNSQLNTRISDLREEMNVRLADLDGDVSNLRTDVQQMGERLRGVKIEFAKIDQRLRTLERAVIPAAEEND